MQMNQLAKLSVVAVALGLGVFAPLVAAAGISQDALKAQAKVTEADARAIALAKVPGGQFRVPSWRRSMASWSGRSI
jgi:hypothetical protein